MTQYADFGPLVLSTDVDDAVLSTIQKWMPTYLTALERKRSELEEGQLDRPKAYASVIDDDQFPDYNLPSVIVTTAQTEGEPQQDGEGNYFAAFNVVVSCISRGRNPNETRKLAGYFEGCVRLIVAHQYNGEQQEGELVGAAKLRGWNVAPVSDPTDQGRFLAAGMTHFIVYVDKVVQEGVGPDEDGLEYPPFDPGTPEEPVEQLVTVGSVSVDIQHRT